MSKSSTNQLGCREITCENWSEFISAIRLPLQNQHTDFEDTRIFRGHAQETYKLSSSWERVLASQKETDGSKQGATFSRRSYDEGLKQYLTHFKELAIGSPNSETVSSEDFDWWAIGRHHGLVTPLLDWTKSPYIAAFFAAQETIERIKSLGVKSTTLGLSGKEHDQFLDVWELQCIDDLIVSEEFCIHRRRTDQAIRQKAQQGLFTQLNADNYLCLDEYLASRNMSHLLTCYKIPAVEVTTIILDLHLMNIDHASLYPDLHGAAMQAKIHAAAYLGFGMLAEAISSNASPGFAGE